MTPGHPASRPVDDFDTEVRRVRERLASLQVERLQAAGDRIRHAAIELLRLSALLGDPAPVPLPVLRPTAWSDQLAVVAADLRLAALRTGDTAVVLEATAVLEGLRRELP